MVLAPKEPPAASQALRWVVSVLLAGVLVDVLAAWVLETSALGWAPPILLVVVALATAPGGPLHWSRGGGTRGALVLTGAMLLAYVGVSVYASLSGVGLPLDLLSSFCLWLAASAMTWQTLRAHQSFALCALALAYLLVGAAALLGGVRGLRAGETLRGVEFLMGGVTGLLTGVAVLVVGDAVLRDGEDRLDGVPFLMVGVAGLVFGVAGLVVGETLLGVAVLMFGVAVLLLGVTGLRAGKTLLGVGVLLLGVTGLRAGKTLLGVAFLLGGVGVLMIGVAWRPPADRPGPSIGIQLSALRDHLRQRRDTEG